MDNEIKTSSFFKLIASILLCEAVGLASAMLSDIRLENWFNLLNKPSWHPPNYVFAPVWSFLYFLMGLALWLIWKSTANRKEKNQAIALFALQLFLNFWWSIIFFRFQAMGLAFLEIILLLIAIVCTQFSFAKLSVAAAWLMVPYLFWVAFASALNFSIWLLN